MKIRHCLFLGTLIAFFYSFQPLTAQKAFHIEFDGQYFHGAKQTLMGETYEPEGATMYGFGFHLSGMYDFNERLSAGGGIGAEHYEYLWSNSYPIFGSLRYHPIQRLLPVYAYTNVGYGVVHNDQARRGWLFDLGVGYKHMFRRHFGLRFQLGYHLNEINGIEAVGQLGDMGVINFGKKSIVRHSIAFGIGVIF